MEILIWIFCLGVGIITVTDLDLDKKNDKTNQSTERPISPPEIGGKK